MYTASPKDETVCVCVQRESRGIVKIDFLKVWKYPFRGFFLAFNYMMRWLLVYRKGDETVSSMFVDYMVCNIMIFFFSFFSLQVRPRDGNGAEVHGVFLRSALGRLSRAKVNEFGVIFLFGC
jgi:hypothetical protein